VVGEDKTPEKFYTNPIIFVGISRIFKLHKCVRNFGICHELKERKGERAGRV
jgi:hypothetical protein